MSRVYIKARINIVVDTDLDDVDEIMDNIEFDMKSCNRDDVEVYDATITNYEIADSK